MPNSNGTTPYLLSIYSTDEEIQLALCDRCAGDLPPYQWLKFAEENDRCACCGKPNAVDTTAMPHLWALTPEDYQTWDEYKARLEGGAL